MNPFFCTVNVVLRNPIKATTESGEHQGFLTGYFRNFGIRAENISEVTHILETTVDDGSINWDETVVHDFEKVDDEISKKFFENSGESIWYTSGRIFYPAESRTA